MQFGVCGDPETAAAAARASYDFAEWTVGALLQPREADDAFRATLETVHATPLPYPVLNCFVPGDLKITGPDAAPGALRAYVTTTFERAEQAGVDTIVFGSGGARAIPDGFDSAAAHDQLVSFGAMLAPLAANHGVTVVVEPLNRADCNVLTTVGECAALVRTVDHPGLRLLVDAYHFMRDDDSIPELKAHAGLLAHVHIATVPSRLAPGAEPCDFTAFFAALEEGGYDGRISIESKLPDPDAALPEALATMRRLQKHSP